MSATTRSTPDLLALLAEPNRRRDKLVHFLALPAAAAMPAGLRTAIEHAYPGITRS